MVAISAARRHFTVQAILRSVMNRFISSNSIDLLQYTFSVLNYMCFGRNSNYNTFDAQLILGKLIGLMTFNAFYV